MAMESRVNAILTPTLEEIEKRLAVAKGTGIEAVMTAGFYRYDVETLLAALRSTEQAIVTLRHFIGMDKSLQNLYNYLFPQMPITAEEVEQFEKDNPDPVDLPAELKRPYSEWLPEYVRRKIEKVRTDERLTGFERLLISAIDAMTEQLRSSEQALAEATRENERLRGKAWKYDELNK